MAASGTGLGHQGSTQRRAFASATPQACAREGRARSGSPERTGVGVSSPQADRRWGPEPHLKGHAKARCRKTGSVADTNQGGWVQTPKCNSQSP